MKSETESNSDIAQVDKVLNCLRPAMNADGGDVEPVSVEDGVMAVRLRGTCLVCPSASLTIGQGIEGALKQQIPWVLEVVRVP